MRSLIYAVGILLLVNSCATTNVPPRPEPHHQRLVKDELTQNEAPVFSTNVNDSQAGGVEEEELRFGEAAFINEDAARRKLSAVSEDGEIVLNFEGESIQSVVHTILGEVLQDRAGLEHGNRIAVRSVRIDDCRHSIVGGDFQECRLKLFTGTNVDELDVVRQPAFLKHHRDLEAVWGRPEIQI